MTMPSTDGIVAMLLKLASEVDDAQRKLQAADKEHRGSDWLAVTSPLTETRNRAADQFDIAIMNNGRALLARLSELQAEVGRLKEVEHFARAADRWSNPARREPNQTVTAEEMLSAIWYHPARASLSPAIAARQPMLEPAPSPTGAHHG